MRRARTAVAGIVAVAMLSVGGAACTPVQQQEFGEALGRLITFILFINVYGDPIGVPPATTAPPAPVTP